MEDPKAFGIEIVYIRQFPDSDATVEFEQLVVGMPSMLYTELESKVNEFISMHASARLNEPNGRLRELENKHGKIKGSTFETATVSQDIEEFDDDEIE